MPVSVPFEIKGGSPIVLEVTLEDGSKWEVRITPSVYEVLHDPQVQNPVEPNLPALLINTHFNTITTRKP